MAPMKIPLSDDGSMLENVVVESPIDVLLVELSIRVALTINADAVARRLLIDVVLTVGVSPCDVLVEFASEAPAVVVVVVAVNVVLSIGVAAVSTTLDMANIVGVSAVVVAAGAVTSVAVVISVLVSPDLVVAVTRVVLKLDVNIKLAATELGVAANAVVDGRLLQEQKVAGFVAQSCLHAVRRGVGKRSRPHQESQIEFAGERIVRKHKHIVEKC